MHASDVLERKKNEKARFKRVCSMILTTLHCCASYPRTRRYLVLFCYVSRSCACSLQHTALKTTAAFGVQIEPVALIEVVPCGTTLPLFLSADRIDSLRGAPFYSIETNSLGFFPQLSAPRRQRRALIFVSAGKNALTGANCIELNPSGQRAFEDR
jgi:hypothetical protein